MKEGDGELEVLLPNKITGAANAPVRLVFATEVFVHATTFSGEVFASGEGGLPQPVESGDASVDIATNSLRVLGGEGETPDFIQDLRLSSGVVTPNGDGVNDRLTVAYELFLLPDPIPVALNVYDLQGRRRAHIEVGIQGAGLQRAAWDGRDEQGVLLAPGIYLLDVEIAAEFKSIRSLHPVGVAY